MRSEWRWVFSQAQERRRRLNPCVCQGKPLQGQAPCPPLGQAELVAIYKLIYGAHREDARGYKTTTCPGSYALSAWSVCTCWSLGAGKAGLTQLISPQLQEKPNLLQALSLWAELSLTQGSTRT